MDLLSSAIALESSWEDDAEPFDLEVNAALIGARVLVVADDPVLTDGLVGHLRAHGASVGVTDPRGRGLERLGYLDAHAVLFDPTKAREGVLRGVLDAQPRLRGARLVAFSWTDVWPVGARRPTLASLARSVAAETALDRELRHMAEARRSFPVPFQRLGPARILRALAGANGAVLRLIVATENLRAVVEIGGDLVVSATTYEEGPTPRLVGIRALGAFLGILRGRGHVERHDLARVMTVMSPVREALTLAEPYADPHTRAAATEERELEPIAAVMSVAVETPRLADELPATWDDETTKRTLPSMPREAYRDGDESDEPADRRRTSPSSARARPDPTEPMATERADPTERMDPGERAEPTERIAAPSRKRFTLPPDAESPTRGLGARHRMDGAAGPVVNESAKTQPREAAKAPAKLAPREAASAAKLPRAIAADETEALAEPQPSRQAKPRATALVRPAVPPAASPAHASPAHASPAHATSPPHERPSLAPLPKERAARAPAAPPKELRPPPRPEQPARVTRVVAEPLASPSHPEPRPPLAPRRPLEHVDRRVLPPVYDLLPRADRTDSADRADRPRFPRARDVPRFDPDPTGTHDDDTTSRRAAARTHPPPQAGWPAVSLPPKASHADRWWPLALTLIGVAAVGWLAMTRLDGAPGELATSLRAAEGERTGASGAASTTAAAAASRPEPTRSRSDRTREPLSAPTRATASTSPPVAEATAPTEPVAAEPVAAEPNAPAEPNEPAVLPGAPSPTTLTSATPPSEPPTRDERFATEAPARFAPRDVLTGGRRDRARSDALLAEALTADGALRHQLLYEAALAHPANPHVAYHLAREAQDEGDLENAETWARHAMRLRRRRVEYRELLAEIEAAAAP